MVETEATVEIQEIQEIHQIKAMHQVIVVDNINKIKIKQIYEIHEVHETHEIPQTYLICKMNENIHKMFVVDEIQTKKENKRTTNGSPISPTSLPPTNESLLGEFECESAGDLLQLAVGVVLGVDLDAGFAAAKRHVHARTLERHQRRKRFHLVLIHVVAVTNT